MYISEEQRSWLNFLQVASVPLRRIAANGMPDSVASGCVVNHRGKKFVLSVSHATGHGDGWAAEVKYDCENGTLLYKFGVTNYLAQATLNSDQVEEVDFSYAEVPADFESWFQIVEPNGSILSQTKRAEFNYTRHEPDVDATYGFSGQVRTSIQGSNQLVSEMVVYPGLRFQHSKNGYHTFKLPVRHPGHDAFKGCSGAPIIDTNGRVVALVCSGDMSDDTITGVSLAKFGVALDVHVQSAD